MPTPPGPVIVTTRCSRASSASAARSAARPSSGAAGSGRLPGRLANRSPLPSSAARIRHDDAVGRDGVELERPTDVLELEPPERTTAMSPRFLSCSYAESESITPPGTANDSIREAMFTASPVSRSGSTITSPTWMPIRTGTSCDGELTLDRDRGLHGRERAREHAHAAVAEPLDDRPAERLVAAVERAQYRSRLLDRLPLVRLDQRGVADHVGEHHRDQPAIEPLTHGHIWNLLGTGSRITASRVSAHVAYPSTKTPVYGGF